MNWPPTIPTLQTCIGHRHAVKHWWSNPCYFTQKHTFEIRGAKAPCLTFLIRERMFQGAKVPGNESYRECKYPEAKVPGSESSTYGTFALGSESMWERKFQLPFVPSYRSTVWRYVVFTESQERQSERSSSVWTVFAFKPIFCAFGGQFGWSSLLPCFRKFDEKLSVVERILGSMFSLVSSCLNQPMTSDSTSALYREFATRSCREWPPCHLKPWLILARHGWDVEGHGRTLSEKGATVRCSDGRRLSPTVTGSQWQKKLSGSSSNFVSQCDEVWEDTHVHQNISCVSCFYDHVSQYCFNEQFRLFLMSLLLVIYRIHTSSYLSHCDWLRRL